MESQILRPKRNTLEIKGKLSYGESNRSWNTLRFKKELLNEFPQLKEKLSKFSYKMVFYQEFNELEKVIRKFNRDGEAVPILLWLVKEKPIN